ncbi:tetratricopeptide repeat (TPR)-like superfamily protein [Actinidia rufa]|uniref:Tetratricopeptide repeat (TPR)-like superfamily protein n=1 Tax=Actinidia rufa TaxID=165716 RepID=A0A7J0DUA1_9ERIC|nr:tetratricopeptide repeat (TPR)-like superfamily protein [Actinidia rufa]
MNSIQTLLRRLIQNPSSIKSKSQAKQFHAQLLKIKSTNSPSSLSSIILSLYTNLNLYHESLTVFNTLHPPPPPLAYKSIIRLYTSNGLFLKSLTAFVEFRASGNALMNMYSKLHSLGINGGSSSVADEVFDKSPESRGFVDHNKLIGNKVDRNGIVLNIGGNSERKGPSVIAGNAQNGMYEEALNMVREMGNANLQPDSFTLSSVLPIFAEYVNVVKGKEIHGSLVDMYAKCGNIKIAKWIFNSMEQHDMVSWTAMIMGCALHGHAHEAISLFEQMEMEGVKPNSVAFIAVLTACSHAKLVDEAWQYFTRMIQVHGIAPSLEHYAAVADLLGRAGKLEEASAGKWKDAAKLRTAMRDKGMRKKPACSWIEVKNNVHAFVAGDKSHPSYFRKMKC